MRLRCLFFVTSLLSLPAIAYGADPTVEQCLESSERGQRLQTDGKYTRARELFTACAARSCPAPVQRECVSALADVERAMPTIAVVVRDDADQDVIDARVFVDGALQKITGTSLALDPGEHKLRVEAPGHSPADQAFVATVGEKSRLVRVRLARLGAPPPVTPAGSDKHDAKTITPTRPGDDVEPSGPPPLAWVLGGVAVVGVGTSIFLGLSARSDLSDLKSAPCAASKTCDESDVRSIKTRLAVADISLGIAALAAVGSVWLFVTAPSSPRAGYVGVRAQAGGLRVEGAF